GLDRGRGVGIPFKGALALSHVAFLGTVGADPKEAGAHAEEGIAHSIEHGLAGPEHEARFPQGALLAQSGDPQQGVELMRSVMAAAESNGARNRRTLYRGHIAAAHASLGRPGVGLDLPGDAYQASEL